MAQIIEFGAAPDIDAMDAAALRDYLAEIRERIARLDEDEPEDMASEAYDEWSEQHEKLEDIADDILDRLEEHKPCRRRSARTQQAQYWCTGRSRCRHHRLHKRSQRSASFSGEV